MHSSHDSTYARIGGCESLPALRVKHYPHANASRKRIVQKFKRLELYLSTALLLAIFRICALIHASAQSDEQPFPTRRAAPTRLIQAARSGFLTSVTGAPRRSLAAADILHDGSLSWQEAQELPADEADILAALWNTAASSPGLANQSAPRDATVADGEGHKNGSRSTPLQNTPDKPKVSRWRDPAGNKKPRYRVIGDGGGGALYELAEELNRDPGDDLPDLVMTEGGLKLNTSTTTTTTPPPVLRFQQCADASARGYAMPFACCSVRNGDFYDKRTWHCGRIPTSLDAVFIRHFVRLPASRPKLELRALWLVKSVDPQFEGKTGILRSGQLAGGRCSAETTEARSNVIAAPSVEELNTLRDVLGSMLNGGQQVSKASLSDVCASLRAEPFSSEEDFEVERLTALIIKDPGVGPLGPTASEIAFTGTTEALGESNGEQDETDTTIVDRQVRVETNIPISRSGNRGNVTPREGRKPWGDTRTMEREQLSSTREDDGEEKRGRNEDATSPIVPFDFGRTFQPVAGLAARLPPSSPNPYFSAGARGLGTRPFSKRRKFAEPLSLKGTSTLRVEPGAALLFLSGASVVTDAPVRNDGTLFIGEVQMSEDDCGEKRPPSQHGMCRIPSLSSGGSVIAKTPAHVHWLQLSSPVKEEMEPVAWYGSIGYPPGLPASSSSTITFYGHVKVNKILPGSSFSFSRLGFPPYPPPPQSPQKTVLQVKEPKESVDLIIYVDIIDDDGFIDCCEEFYDREPAVFDIKGVNLKLGPYTGRRKDVGDHGRTSEQVILRANRITTDETFVGLPPLISSEDAKVTNNEEQRKQAGTNRDIVFFQCAEECRISSQIFKAKKGYKYVQVTRDLPPARSSSDLIKRIHGD